MTATLLALAILAQPETSASRKQAYRIASAILPVAQKKNLDPTLLAAIAIAETGGRNQVAYKRGKRRRGADVGVFQIHCRFARPGCIKRFQNLRRSASEAGTILTLGRRLCQNPPQVYERMCKRGFWARYNPGSRRWSKRVQKIWDRIKDHLEHHTGA